MGTIATVFGACVAIYGVLIGVLRLVKRLQPIYELSPETHQHKSVPSFGGVGMMLGLGLCVWVFNIEQVQSLWLVGVFMSFGAIGLIDDGLAMVLKANKGLGARHKMGLQIVLALGALAMYHVHVVPLVWWAWAWYVFIIVGFSNAANLTDGLDGLLTGTSLIVGVGLWLLLPGLAPFWMSAAIVLVAFLMWNRHPASLFMGDTGSLAIGATVGASAVILDTAWPIIALCGVWVLETLSVMIQVAWYKRTKTRIFLMSPLHHHFELMGLSEARVVWLFWIMQLGFLSLMVVLYL